MCPIGLVCISMSMELVGGKTLAVLDTFLFVAFVTKVKLFECNRRTASKRHTTNSQVLKLAKTKIHLPCKTTNILKIQTLKSSLRI